ncbi:hypothetical protein T03_10115 [Trichinella britovi]|uniref:Uncharacterized protein n=1 Tax=Trichinella britovi TaxID=45882 RepID=A0A0V1CTL2_TRIBR|nr:hypothetical protein T03_10115 [Trichinella britovi]
MNSNVQNLRTAAVSVNGRIGETELPVLGEWGRQYCAPYAERTPSFVRLCSCPLVNQLLLYIFPFRLRNTHAFSELLKLRFWFSYFDVQSRPAAPVFPHTALCQVDHVAVMFETSHH